MRIGIKGGIMRKYIIKAVDMHGTKFMTSEYGVRKARKLKAQVMQDFPQCNVLIYEV